MGIFAKDVQQIIEKINEEWAEKTVQELVTMDKEAVESSQERSHFRHGIERGSGKDGGEDETSPRSLCSGHEGQRPAGRWRR